MLLQTGFSVQTQSKKAHSTKTKAHAATPQAARKLKHITRAFVASADLRPMAQQLQENRTPQAYAGVEAYARKHQTDDAGPLAWLVVGYAHYLDKDYANALLAWTRTAALTPVLGDYLDYLRASAYQGEADHAAVAKTLQGFEQKYPDSLYLHETVLLYASALMATDDPLHAAAYLEKHRQPMRPDVEIALARAYLATHDKSKAADIFHRLYFEMPLSAEADAAAVELRSMGEAQPVGNFEQRHTRA